jgi:hypothetical protein
MNELAGRELDVDVHVSMAYDLLSTCYVYLSKKRSLNAKLIRLSSSLTSM